MKPEHHSQRVDLETGYIEATRDDTDEYQDLRVKAYTPDGTLIQESRIIYNVQYDYSRRQEWRNSVLIDDRVIPHHAYGHLQWEFSLQPPPPEDWVNPYPDNYEPVKPEGADMFHREGLGYGFICFEMNITADVNFYIWEDLEEWRKQGMNLITDAEITAPYDQWIVDKWKQEEEERLKNPFDPRAARDMRLVNLGKQCKEIGVNIPIDPRFID